MIESLYVLTLVFVLYVLKAHPASMIFVFIVNFFTGFTPIVTIFMNYDLVDFNREFVLFLLTIFNFSIISFHIIFLLFFLKKNRCKYLYFKKYKFTPIILFVFSFIVLFSIYKNTIQSINMINYGYVGAYGHISSSEGVKATSLFPFLLIYNFFLFTIYLRTKKKYYLLIMAVISLSYLAYGSRSFFIYTAISIVAFLILLNKITYKKCLMYFSFLLPLIVIAGAFREGRGIDGINIVFRIALEMANIPMIISNIAVLKDLNQSVSSIFLTVLPQSITASFGAVPVNSLATEFVTNHDPGWAKAGGGFGFSIIGEIYYRFGYVGLFIIPYMLVLFIHKIEKFFLRGDDFDKALALTSYFMMLMWIRGDFIEISRMLFIILFFTSAKRLVYRNGK